MDFLSQTLSDTDDSYTEDSFLDALNVYEQLLVKITEERRQIPQKVRSKVHPHTPAESHYLDKFVRHLQDDIDILINESKEIDSILSRTTSINSLNSVISSGSASSEGKMSVTSDEGKPRQPQAKLTGMPTGKPPIHNYKQQDSNLNRVRLAVNSCRPESFNSDSGIIASSGSSDSSQSRWSWPEDSKGLENKHPTISESISQKEDASKKLSLVVEELIKSEHDFVLGLRFIVKDYTPELMKSKFWNLGEKLLGNINDIYRFHGELFLPDLLQCNGDPINVATVFLKHKDRYDMHVIYCRNKTISEVVYSEHETEFEDIQKTLTQSLSLSAYLIKPVQRITKYQLLLTEMHKFAKQCNLVNVNKIELAQNVMLEVPRRANNLMHLEMLDNPPEDLLIFQDSLSVTSGNAWISNQGKTRQVFLFKNFLVLAKHEVESKKLQYYSRKTVIELASCILHSESDTNRFSVSTGSVKYWFSAPTPVLKAEWIKYISECIDYCNKAKCEDHLSIDSTEENRKGIQKIRSSLRFKRRKSLTKLNLKDEELTKEIENNDWCQPYITNSNNNDSLNDTTNTDHNKCLSKLSNISMSIDYINLINDSPEETQAAKSGYKFVDILFYGHFSLFATCEHHRTGLQFTAQIVPIVDRQFYRSIQREVQILKVLNCKRLSRLHEILLEYENYVILVFSYQHQFKLLDYLLLKEVHREADSVEIVKQILEGIAYLHNRNIAHLDLKPDNVIWDKTTIKIINYELAHYVDEENVFLEPKMLDEEFAAPELLMSRVATTASDIWSVGVITYLLLYSDSPFYIQHQIIPPNMRSFQYNSKGSSIFGESTLLFLSSLLQNDLRRRPDTQACLSSAWIKSSNMRLSGATLDKNRLRKFQERRRRSRKTPRFNIPDSLYQELGIGSDML